VSFKNIEQNKNNNRSTKPKLRTSSCFAINFTGYMHCAKKVVPESLRFKSSFEHFHDLASQKLLEVLQFKNEA